MAAKKKQGQLSRRDVAERLGCSIWQVWHFENEGWLKVHRENEPGKTLQRVWYDVDDVIAFASRWQPQRRGKTSIDSQLIVSNVRGQVAKVALPLFEQAKREGVRDTTSVLTAICVETGADPLLIQQIYDQWRRGLDGVAIDREMRARMAREERAQKAHEKRVQREDWINHRQQTKRLEIQRDVEIARATGQAPTVVNSTFRTPAGEKAAAKTDADGEKEKAS